MSLIVKNRTVNRKRGGKRMGDTKCRNGRSTSVCYLEDIFLVEGIRSLIGSNEGLMQRDSAVFGGRNASGGGDFDGGCRAASHNVSNAE